VQLRALPFKLAHSLRQILLIPRDMLRFAGSMRMLIRMLRGALANKAPALTAPQLKKLHGTDNEDEDDELVPSADETDKLASALLGDELATVASDVTNVAQEAEDLPEEPTPGMVITIEDDDVYEDEQPDDDNEDAQYGNGNDEESDLLIDGNDVEGPTPKSMQRDIHPCEGVEVHLYPIAGASAGDVRSGVQPSERGRTPKRNCRHGAELTSSTASDEVQESHDRLHSAEMLASAPGTLAAVAPGSSGAGAACSSL